MKRVNFVFILSLVLFSCKKENQAIEISSEDFHASVDKVTEVMVHDIFSPPVASRIYAYPNIAAYEVLAKNSAEFS